MPYVRPVFISERERAERWVDGVRMDDARWEDCAPVSELHRVMATTGNRKPADKTLDEAERLRLDAGYGPTGGTNLVQLSKAAAKRYAIPSARYATGFDAIWLALRPGYGASVAGSMAAFGPTHRLSRWQPAFDGGHSVYVQRESLTARVWWVDPLAPQGTYTGEWVSKDELRAFLSRGIAVAMVSPVAQVP